MLIRLGTFNSYRNNIISFKVKHIQSTVFSRRTIFQYLTLEESASHHKTSIDCTACVLIGLLQSDLER